MNNLDWIKGAGVLIGGLGQAYGAIESAKAQKKAYNFNKYLVNRGIEKEEKAQAVWDNASAKYFGDDKKKKENPKLDLGV